jgi:branched-chain amino acid transport system permease protein
VGSALFAGGFLIGPINALIAVAPWAQNPTSLLPGLAGMAFGRSPDGVVPMARRDWAPVARHRAALGVAITASGGLWVLRLAGVINGWVLFWGVAVAAAAVRIYASTRATAGEPAAGPAPQAPQMPQAEPVPVEWWGLRRPWQPGDEEALDRAVARG